MRNRLMVLLVTAVLFTNCGALRKAGLIPNELEMATGLKSALERGLLSGFDQFANPQGNSLLKLAMPGEIGKLETVLSTLGVKTNLGGIANKLTYAMSQSATVAKPVFLNALKKMSIKDAAKILVTNNNQAATDYFRATATPELTQALLPIIDSTVKLDGLAKEYADIASVYNAIPFLNKKIEPTATGFIAGRTIDLMFMMVAKEEAEIRTKYQLRKTDLLRKVFNYAEQEVKRKYGSPTQ